MDYTNKKFEEIDTWLKLHLNNERYLHSLGTMECAVELAKMFNLDEAKAKTAGLLHDCAKCFSNEELLNSIKTNNLDVEESEMINFKTLHAPVSAYLAKKEFGVNDKEILSSIRWHTLGYCGMTEFDKIIFLADKIEPNMRPQEYRTKMFNLLKEENGLNKALFICFSETIKSLVERKLTICHITIDVYNELLNCVNDTKYNKI